ncbi:hypothetical protein RIV07_30160, partial [Pseudomonas baetica]
SLKQVSRELGPGEQVAQEPLRALPVSAARVVAQRPWAPVSVSAWQPVWAWEPASVAAASQPVRLPRAQAAQPLAGQVAVA